LGGLWMFFMTSYVYEDGDIDKDYKTFMYLNKRCPKCTKKIPSYLTTKCPHCTADL
jgi:hypothetical protein